MVGAARSDNTAALDGRVAGTDVLHISAVLCANPSESTFKAAITVALEARTNAEAGLIVPLGTL